METVTTTQNATTKGWEPLKQKEDTYTANDLIDAYIKGKNDGLDQAQRAIYKLLDDNIKLSIEVTAKVTTYLKGVNFTPQTAYLKVYAWDNLEILISVPEEQFLDDSFLGAYKFVGDVESSTNNDHINLCFSFISISDQMDENHIASDGYIFKHQVNA